MAHQTQKTAQHAQAAQAAQAARSTSHPTRRLTQALLIPALDAAFVVGALLASGLAEASPLTYTFDGKVSSIISDDNSHVFSSHFAVGDAVSGSYTFDSAAVGQNAAPVYFQTFLADFSVTIAGQNFWGSAEYRIFDNDPTGGDGYSIINEHGNFNAPALGNLVPSTFFVQFLQMPVNTLNGFNLVTDPSALIPLSNPLYAPHGLRLDDQQDRSFGALYFTLNKPGHVPEPAAWMLAALGLGAAALPRRRKPRDLRDDALRITAA